MRIVLAIIAALAIVYTAAAETLPPMPPPEFNPAPLVPTPEPPSWPRAYLPAVWQEAQP